MQSFLKKATFLRLLQFTGSSRVGELLTGVMKGKIKLEDAGFDWKILGPDVSDVDYVAWQCDQDAYAASGQKCSAQSIMFVHRNWMKTHFLDKVKELAERRKLSDLTIGPVLTWNNEQMEAHIKEVLELEGAKLLFGGKRLTGHTIPPQFGSMEPTAIFVPLRHFKSMKKFKLLTTELFGPFQIVTEFVNTTVDQVIECLENMDHNLTAAIVSNDVQFTNHIISNSVNGTTYAGLRARTTGAPQNHWFGPCGDPRGAGIGTAEAIQMVWSSHREIITDVGPTPENWVCPNST